MKKSELEQMISEIVKKECKEAITEALTNLFGNTPVHTQHTQLKSVVKEIKKETAKPIQKETRKFCNNPVLNQLLSETLESPTTATRMAANNDKGPAFLNGSPSMTQHNIPSKMSSLDSIKMLNENVNESVEEVQYQASNMPDMTNFAQSGNSRFSEILKKSLEKSNKKLG